MAGGEGFSAAHRAELTEAVQAAQARSGLPFTLYVGPLSEGRASALALHAQTESDPQRTVLLAVDPAGRSVEIVTGPKAAQRVDARACGLATATMTSSFEAGDLLGGIRNGLQLLGDHAHRPEMLHLDDL